MNTTPGVKLGKNFTNVFKGMNLEILVNPFVNLTLKQVLKKNAYCTWPNLSFTYKVTLNITTLSITTLSIEFATLSINEIQQIRHSA